MNTQIENHLDPADLMDMNTNQYTAEEIELEAKLTAAANEEGTIQAGDMLSLAPRPTFFATRRE